jgi:hypothetical protein
LVGGREKYSLSVAYRIEGSRRSGGIRYDGLHEGSQPVLNMRFAAV